MMDRPNEQIPDGIEPLVGYREWTYELAGTRASLHPVLGPSPSVKAPNPWAGAESGWVVATCDYMGFDLDELGDLGGVPIDRSHPYDHGEVPGESCTCGFYSFKSLARLLPMSDFRPPSSSGPTMGSILGRVELAGKIVEHDLGYRAERARIAQLIPLEDDLANAARVAEMLGVDLGDPVPPYDAMPDPPPPKGPSSVRLRVSDWVRDVAA